ncbi:hypothetical protein E4U43_000925 [Claviceps pusilla]|uniref:FYVE-type domain-containing protein n=1 Tax=Claviceps pusilla TaxID=123648 RepID=A0A9P7SZQ7_9HYPO|nr:hypothetical protein E4U43_000925 [Claviceps pusilla]
MAAELIMPTFPADQQRSRHFLPSNMSHMNNTSNTSNMSNINNMHSMRSMHTNGSSPGHTFSNHYYRPHHARSRSHQVSSGLQISPLDTSAMPPSPLGSTPPSPIAHHNPYAGRPMYMPAVLRRCDEFPPTKVTRCRTAGSTSSSDSDSTLKRANTVLMSIPGLSMLGHHFARRSTCENNNNNSMTLDGDWKLDNFPQVAGMPTRKHWKPDSESTICDDPVCKRTFNYFVRRHHCRKCGDIFCDWHSSAALPLDHNAEFNPRASPSRTCNYCFNQVKSLHIRNGSQSSSSTIDDVPTPTTPMNAPTMPGVTPPHKPEVPASAPRDWNWSTF